LGALFGALLDFFPVDIDAEAGFFGDGEVAGVVPAAITDEELGRVLEPILK
jgi:hypothetical protein